MRYRPSRLVNDVMRRAVVVLAVRAGDRVEAPLARASAANQQTLGGGIDERELRLAAAQRAAGLVPVAQLQPRQQGLGAARQERAHRQQQHLIEQLTLVASARRSSGAPAPSPPRTNVATTASIWPSRASP